MRHTPSMRAGASLAATETGVTSTFTPDALDQLTAYSVPGESATLAYSATDNRTSQTVNGTPKTLTYGAADRLTADGSLTVVHDTNGSVTQYGTAALTWDARGRLVQVVSGGTTSTFQYDCLNRRVAKTVNGVTKRYLWLGADLAAETDANYAVTASYFF